MNSGKPPSTSSNSSSLSSISPAGLMDAFPSFFSGFGFPVGLPGVLPGFLPDDCSCFQALIISSVLIVRPSPPDGDALCPSMPCCGHTQQGMDGTADLFGKIT